MNKFKTMKKSSWIFFSILLISLLGAVRIFNFRIDLTQEKRYTLSDETTEILKQIKEPLKIKVYLEGDFPADFRQLRNETQYILEEFKKKNPKLEYEFIDPIKTKMSQDTLQAMGMAPSMLPHMKDGKISQIILFPYAAIQYKGYGVSVPLITQQRGISASEQMNKSIEELEYSLISSIKDLTLEKRKNIGFLVNQEELKPQEFDGFLQMALENYNVGPVIPQNQKELSLADLPKLNQMQALVIAKPRKAFGDQEKLVIDQYIMNGGKTLWLLDAVNAEMDTLFQSKKIMAFPVDLNLTDFMFNYGVRINPGLVKDMKQSALLRVEAGEIAGNPQYNSFLWPYFPLGISQNNHPITKNINPIKFEFPTSIDTLSRPGLKHTVLFESSEATLVKPVPNYVNLNEIANIDSLAQSEKPTTPKIFGVLVEGKFKSAYAQRSEKNEVPNFKSQSSQDNKMIVMADGDLARNSTLKGEALPLGYDLLTNVQYGNEQFLRNAIDYLLDDTNLMSLRGRNIELRLLDKAEIDENKGFWQSFNLLLPIVILVILALIFNYLHKKKYQ